MRRLVSLMALGLAFISGLWAEDNWSRQINVSAARLRATISMQESYKVGEPIRFKVKANKDAYLYIFYLTKDKKLAKLLYPNKLDKNNRLKADKVRIVPDPEKSEFTADAEGEEKLVFVLSTKKLSTDTLLLLNQTDSRGYSYTEGENVDKLLKDLQVLHTEGKKKKKEIWVGEVVVKIEEE